MHGAVLLDRHGAVLRPCMLWNDTRAAAECRELEAALPSLHAVTGNPAMPGFTAPKLLWVRRHEPELFARVATVLLPKAWIRFRITGERIEEMSDASGTLWLDVRPAATGRTRRWRRPGCRGRRCRGWSRAVAPAGRLHPDLAARWGMANAPILAGGAGDKRGRRGRAGRHPPGQRLRLAGHLGRAVGDHRPVPPQPRPGGAQPSATRCPASGTRWASRSRPPPSLAWWAGVAGRDEAALLAELGPAPPPAVPIFLPYLSGRADAAQ